MFSISYYLHPLLECMWYRPQHYRTRGDGALLEFELTSGVADMWPRLEEAVRRQWMSGVVTSKGAESERK